MTPSKFNSTSHNAGSMAQTVANRLRLLGFRSECKGVPGRPARNVIATDAAKSVVSSGTSRARMARQLYLMQDIIDLFQPPLLSTPQHIDTFADRLVSYSLTLVSTEAERRSEAQPRRASSTTPKRADAARGKRFDET